MAADAPDFRRCLTVKNPWAFLIIRPDLTGPARTAWLASPLRKDIENRTWATAYRGRIFIHVGLAFDMPGFAELYSAFPALRPALESCQPDHENGQKGGIIGSVRIVENVRSHSSLWFRGPVGWVLGDPQAHAFEPMRGFQGLWMAGSAKPAPAPAMEQCPDCNGWGTQDGLDPEGPITIQCTCCKGAGERLKQPLQKPADGI